MNFSTLRFKKLFVTTLLLVSFMDAAVPVMAADTTVFSGDATTSAVITDLGGANVNAKTDNYAQIGITGNGNTITWSYLNVVAGKTLDFNFITNGQVALNKVTNGMSYIGGNLITSGADGRLIISNPNGMLFENGSYTNANALMLTTQNVNWDGNLYGALTLSDYAGGKSIGGIQIGNGDMNNAAIMRVAEDLNIISNGIKIDGADILAGGNVRLITADGVTFAATPNTNSVEPTLIASTNNNAITYDAVNSDGNTVKSSILVEDSAIAVKDNGTNKIYFITKGDSDKASIAAIKSNISGKTDLDVAGNADFEVYGNLDIDGSDVGGDLIAKTLDGTFSLSGSARVITNEEITTLLEYIYERGFWTITLDTLNRILNGQLTLRELALILFGDTNTPTHIYDTYKLSQNILTESTNTQISGRGNITISDTTVGGNAIVDGANVSITNFSANNLDVKSSESTLSYSRDGYQNKYNSETDYKWTNTAWEEERVWIPTHIEGGRIIWGHYEGTGNPDYSKPIAGGFTPYLVVETSMAPPSKVIDEHPAVQTSTGSMSLETITTGNLKANAYGELNATGLDINRNASLISTSDDVTVTNSNISNKLTSSAVNITLNNTSAKKLYANADEKLTLENQTDIGRVRAFAADIDVDNSKIGSGRMKADNDIVVENTSEISKAKLNAGHDINIYDSTIKTSKLNAGNNVYIDPSLIEDSKISAVNNIDIYDSTVNKSKLTAGVNVNIKDHSKLINSYAKAKNDININHSKVIKSTLNAKDDVNISNHSELTASKVKADDDINIGHSNVIQSTLSAKDDFNVSNRSKLIASQVKAGDDINIGNGSSVINSKLSARDDINIYNHSSLINSKADANDDINIYDSTIISSKLDARDNIYVDPSFIEDSTLTAKNNITVEDSTVNNSTLAAGRDVNINHSNVNNSKVFADNNVNVINRSALTNTFVQADNDINIDSSNVQYSALIAKDDINVKNHSKLNMVFVGAKDDISVAGSNVDKSILKAGDDLKISYSTVKTSKLSAGDDINISNHSNVINSYAKADEDINIYDSRISNSTIDAGYDIYVDPSIIENSTLIADNCIRIYDSIVKSSNLRAQKFINIDNSTVEFSWLTAIDNDIWVNDNSIIKYSILTALRDDINVYNSTVEGSILTAYDNIWIGSSEVNNSFITSHDATWMGNSQINRSILNAGETILITNGSDVDRSILNAVDGIYVRNFSSLNRSLLNSGANINVNNSYIGYSRLNADNNIDISSSVINNVNLDALNDINILGSLALGKINAETTNGDITIMNTVGNADFDLTSGDDIYVYNSGMNSALMNAINDITLEGIYVSGDLTITGANNVLISNSDTPSPEGYPTIPELAIGMSPITDYNIARFDDAFFNTMGAAFGAKYGIGTRISYIGGNLDISNANLVTLVNTAVVGNLTESNIATDTNLITSYVGGDYTPDRATIAGDASVFQSYIKGTYIDYYPDGEDDYSNLNDINRLKYGEELDAVFRQHFNPRGFAAGEDEIRLMKNTTLSSLVKNNKNFIQFTKPFYAY
ncbi:MAG: filamentous hemagglutinin N-terminal domain-containing protein [Candidatus Gastranaerophilales bacterium]|nr:filamentous hemagglutinin N-terminal domain-containing protein [Candidatus Gastranaerophilales bacterium]